MVCAPVRDQDRGMTETQTPPDGPSGSAQQTDQAHDAGQQQPHSRVDTANLRDYAHLRRSQGDRKIAGVAGGLGRHLNIDPTVIRVILVVLIFFGGAGVVLYVAAWLLVPEEGTEKSVINSNPATRNALLIVAVVFATLLLLGDTWGGWGGPFPWPIAVVGAIVLVVMATRDKSGTPSTPSASAPPASSEPGVPVTGAGPSGPPSWTYPATTYAAPPPAPPRPSKADRGPKLFGFTLAFVALALGALGLYEASGADVADAAYAALALSVIGVMLVVGAFAGRPGGLIFLGIIASLALAVTATVDQYGYRYDSADNFSYTPRSTADLADEYSMLAGRMDVDLSQIRDPENLDGRALALQAEAGDLFVTVPEGVDVVVDANIRIGGEIDIERLQADGRSPSLRTVIDGGEDVPQMNLDIELTVGTIDVRQLQTATSQEGTQR